MTPNILPCPMCKSAAVIFSTSASECYGHAWQYLSVECENTTKAFCGMELSIHADFYNIRNAEEQLIKCWNALDR